MARKKRILYIHPNSSTFVRKDIAFLGRRFEVVDREYKASGASKGIVMMLRQLVFMLGHLRRTKVVFIMFGGYHSFVPALLGRLFGKRVYIILGGTDCVSFPSINYGTFRKRLQGKVTCASYRLAHRLIPVHESLMERKDSYYTSTRDPEEQGAYVHCRGLRKKTPFTAIHNGYDPEKWDVSDFEKKPGSFITVAGISSLTQITLKGIGLIEKVAERFPECSFTIVGFQNGSENLLKDHPNLHCIPYAQPEDLRDLFGETQFYLQLSISEGFPNALSEAMLSECIPVGSRVAGIPHIIGETGLLLDKYDVDQLADLLKEALALPEQDKKGKAASQRIANQFHIEKREQAYFDLVKEFL